jgi:putative intracellular protease/amidase
VITPARIMVLGTLLSICSAALLLAAGREPQAGTVFGAALASGAATLAIFLSEQRRVTVAPEMREQIAALVQQGRTLKAVRRLRESAPTDTRSAYRYVRQLERKPPSYPAYTTPK